MNPTYDNVFVVETKEVKQTESGIILSDSVATGAKPAIIKAVGPDATDFNVGNTVYLKWGSALAVTTPDGTPGAIISKKDIVAVV